MAITTRQTSLLVQQDWTKVYQTFREADFQSFDYETLRKSMIEYLRTYYPEDFNDFTDSSEYIALIDLIAFLGQSLAFRTDLNARENFIDTAERRDSILKLARLVSYNPKRSIPASGFLKFDSVSTTETIFDTTGINLSNTIRAGAGSGSLTSTNNNLLKREGVGSADNRDRVGNECEVIRTANIVEGVSNGEGRGNRRGSIGGANLRIGGRGSFGVYSFEDDILNDETGVLIVETNEKK